MSLSASGFASLSTRIVAATVSALPAVITMGSTEYDCTIDPSALAQVLEDFGQNPSQTLEALVPNSESMSPALDRTVTITATATDALEGVVFLIKGIVAHPNLPAKILTLERVP